MAVREFTDSRGVEWRVWDVTPQHMHPVTRIEDYMSSLQDGWLAFEAETEKRRLEAPYPKEWTTLSIQALEALCARAAPVVRRTTQSNVPQSSIGQQRAVRAAKMEQDAMRDAHAQIAFNSPGGRRWTVRIHECIDRAGDEETVLRFTTEDIVVELSHWPERWQSSTVEEFALMLLDANPPRARTKGEGPQRRRADRVAPDVIDSSSSAARAR